MYILVTITSIFTPQRTAFYTKTKNGECRERSFEGVTCFIVELSTFYLNFNI